MSTPADSARDPADPDAELAALRAALARAEQRIEYVKSQIETRSAETRAVRARAQRLAIQVRSLRAAIAGVPPVQLGKAGPEPPSREQIAADVRTAAELHAETDFVRALRRGEHINTATEATVRGLLAVRRHVPARALGYGLLVNPATEEAGRLAIAIVAAHQTLTALAFGHLAELPRAVWRTHASTEMFATAFVCDPVRARHECEALLEDADAAVSDRGWLVAAGAAYGAGERELAARLLEALAEMTDGAPELPDAERRQFEWLLAWVRRAPARAAEAAALEPSPAIPVLGILDYKQPDPIRTSSNLGDYVQTLAAVGNIVRHEGVSFEGSRDLSAAMTRLAERVRPDRRVPGPARRAHVIAVDRDCSSEVPVAPGTWLLAFGWYMQSQFDRRYDFPLHPNLRPIFISFHVNRRALLTPPAIEYLRRHAPIGCRDWTTVYLLLGEGIPAFFSGCLSTTIDTLFEDLPTPRPDRLGVIDVRLTVAELAEVDGELGTHVCPEVRGRDLAANLDAAAAVLDGYRHRYGRILTSRLHCYLPSVALGFEVDFRPSNEADIRFDGLLGLTPGDARLASMQQSLLTKLAAVLRPILDGAAQDDVEAIWRAVCADDVDVARAVMAAGDPPLDPGFDIPAACRTIRLGARRFEARDPREGEPVHVALSLDENLREQLPVVVQALVSSTTRPVELWIQTRGLDEDYIEHLASAFEEDASFTFLPCDRVDYGKIASLLRHTTVATMDRLLLPELLPEIDRIAYQDVDALVIGDVSELFDIDLEGTPLAARSSLLGPARSGLEYVYRPARRLDPAIAGALRRRTHRRIGGEFAGFNAGVLVLDLALMRAEGFCAEFVHHAGRYGMNDQEVLNCYVGPRRAYLPAEWNFWPTQELQEDPKLVHWAGPAKPWQEDAVACAAAWRAADAAYRRRLYRSIRVT